MFDFTYDGPGLGKGGTASLYVDGKKVGEGKVGATAPIIFSADDGCDVGVDTGAPVSPDYGAHGNEFSGRVKGVQLAIAIRKALPATEIVLLSGQAGITDILERGRKEGYSFELIAKPVHPEKLLQRLKKGGSI